MAGNFLIHQLIIADDSKFGLSVGEIAAFGDGLPESMRPHFSFWATFYLGWLMRDTARELYGREFYIEMMAHAFARLENSRDIVPDIDVPVSTLRNFFARLDDALGFYNQQNSAVENRESVPLVYVVAVSLLMSTEDTPYFNNQKPLDGLENDLAMALARLDERARPLVIAGLQKTATSPNRF